MSFGAFDMNSRGSVGSSRGCSNAAFPVVYEADAAWEGARLTRPEEEVLVERARRERCKHYEQAKRELARVRAAASGR